MELSLFNSSGLRSQNVLRTSESLTDYISSLEKVLNRSSYDTPETFINLPYDEDLLSHLHIVKKNLCRKNPKYILIVGIGGSNLGTKAVYDALFGYFDIIEPTRFPKALFVDTTDPSFLSRLEIFLKDIPTPEELVINVISKSGSTLETLVNLELILGVNKKFKERLVITTEFESDLWFEGQKLKIPLLPLSKEVGGRFSVFTSVGIFPFILLNINVVELMSGAMDANEVCLSSNVENNPSLLSAIFLYLNYVKGKNIHDTFFFHSELESLGKWYRQLLAESLGKRGLGITPTVSIGSTDLHSMAQLYISGPKDKSFAFVWSLKKVSNRVIKESTPFSNMAKNVKGKSAEDILHAILHGIRETFKENKIPFIDVKLNAISERDLGFYMQYKMIETLYLGKLLGINPFGQEDVEQYKQKTREALVL